MVELLTVSASESSGLSGSRNHTVQGHLLYHTKICEDIIDRGVFISMWLGYTHRDSI